MNINGRRIDSDGVFWGLLLMVAGVAMLLQRFGVVDLWRTRDFWPLIIVVIGVSKLVRRRSVWSGLWMITVGAWLQAVTLHLYGLTYESSWPLLLVVLGGGMIVRTVVESFRRRDTTAKENSHE